MVKKSSLFILGATALMAAPFALNEYRDVCARLIGAALSDDSGLTRLEYLCDRIGNRVSGSAALEKAIVWAEQEMKRAGLDNVHTIPVKVRHWVRGQESLVMIEPLSRPIAMLGLGDSVGTGPNGVEAEVVTVSNFDELEKLGRAKVAGKIVLYSAPYVSYGTTNVYRNSGPARAAALGAVGALVRSITPVSLRDPHTGATNYGNGPKIPAAAVSLEDAMSIARLTARGERVRVRLTMNAEMLPDADSFDVMGEIRGREKPDEVVVLGGHIDSWDVGQGAQDDGAGIMAAMNAVVLMKQLNIRPRRTVRVVFWTNEENGSAGGRAYRDWLGDGVKNHVAAIEMDEGAEKPIGYTVGNDATISEGAFNRASDIGKLLEGINAGAMTRGGGGTDINPLTQAGVPSFGLRTVGLHYFDWHHSNADTFDKVDPQDFRLNVASLAVLSYTLAEMPERLSNVR
jgi:hypothetical protein